MEVEDPVSAKFRTLVEALMVKTTSEIVKVFVDVLLETRVEISRSWKEIDALKLQLEQREEPRVGPVLRSQVTQVTLKHEDCMVDNIQEVQEDVSLETAVSDTSPVEPASTESQDEVQIPTDAPIENTDVREECVPDNVQAAPAITTPVEDTPDVSSSVTTSNQNLETQVIPRAVKCKKGRSRKSHRVTKLQTTTTDTSAESETPVQPLPVVSSQQPSSSTGIIILSKWSKEKGAAVIRKKYMQKNVSSTHESPSHVLRGRQFISQRPCLCCPSNQCSVQQSQPKNSSPVVPRVYSCKDCGTSFEERAQFKGHKCSLTCTRCGQTFTSVRTLTIHSRGAHPSKKNSFPYRCYLCDHMFSTLCAWNMHKKIHAHGRLFENVQQDTPSISCSLPVPKELNTKVEVRLQRISHAQLEAALSPKSSTFVDDKNGLSSLATSEKLLSATEVAVCTGGASSPSEGTILNTPVLTEECGSRSDTTSVVECQGSTSGTGLGEMVSQADGSVEDSGLHAPSTQSVEKRMPGKVLTLCNRSGNMEYDEPPSSPSEELSKGVNTRKRKISDCSHDMYNGVFPVEKILKWRNVKGRNEVRIKWMPCSLCGAKWKNTWEPAESFISYKDDKHDGSEQTDKQK